MNELYETYMEIKNTLVAELPTEAAPLGEFFIKWFPVIFLVSVLAKLIDQLFERASIKFIANGFIKLCELVIKDAFKEPTHKGLIIEAPLTIQRLFYRFCAWMYGLQSIFFLLFTVLAFYPMLTMQIRDDYLIEGVIVLSFMTGACTFLAFVQAGLCHQYILLSKSLKTH